MDYIFCFSVQIFNLCFCLACKEENKRNIIQYVFKCTLVELSSLYLVVAAFVLLNTVHNSSFFPLNVDIYVNFSESFKSSLK